VHKIHHEWQAPIAITASYAHPIENIITVYVSVSAGIHIYCHLPITKLKVVNKQNKTSDNGISIQTCFTK